MSDRAPAAEIAFDQHHPDQEQRRQSAEQSQQPRWPHQTPPTNGPALGHGRKPGHSDVGRWPTNHWKR